jgi:hypothetical protein
MTNQALSGKAILPLLAIYLLCIAVPIVLTRAGVDPFLYSPIYFRYEVYLLEDNKILVHWLYIAILIWIPFSFYTTSKLFPWIYRTICEANGKVPAVVVVSAFLLPTPYLISDLRPIGHGEPLALMIHKTLMLATFGGMMNVAYVWAWIRWRSRHNF